METLCWHPGSYKSRATSVLIGLTQIPLAIANLIIRIGIIQLNNFNAILIPIFLIILSVLSLYLAPESPRWLLQIKDRVNEAFVSLKSLWSGKISKHEINKEIAVMQREMQVIII